MEEARSLEAGGGFLQWPGGGSGAARLDLAAAKDGQLVAVASTN